MPRRLIAPDHEDRTFTVIGWREYVALPDWGIVRIKAKADTGARSSAIDVGHLEELPGNRVRFDVATDRTRPEGWVSVETDIVRRTRIKSSFGAAHDRFVVRTMMKLGPIEKEIELSLVSRKDMLCRMLLGRVVFEPDILVDSGRTYLWGNRPPRKRAKSSREDQQQQTKTKTKTKKKKRRDGKT